MVYGSFYKTMRRALNNNILDIILLVFIFLRAKAKSKLKIVFDLFFLAERQICFPQKNEISCSSIFMSSVRRLKINLVWPKSVAL